MNKQNIVIALVIIVILGAFFIFKGSSNKITIESEDGAVRLTIPDGALPEGVSPNDLSITIINEEEISEDTSGDYFSIKEIELNPSGLSFNKPVKISVTTKYIENTSPILVHISEDDTFEVLDYKEGEINEENSTVTYQAEVEHFSRIDFLTYRTFVAVMDHPGDHFVGESFDVFVDVRKNSLSREFKDDQGHEGTIYIIEDSISLIDGTFKTFGPLNPDEISGIPYRAEMTGDNYRVNQTFTCTEGGSATVRYGVDVYWEDLIDIQNAVFWVLDVEAITNSFGPLFVNVQFNCIDPTVLDEPPKGREGADVELLEKTNDGVSKHVVLLIDGSYYPLGQFVMKNVTEPETGHTCLNERGAHALHYHPKHVVIGEAYGLDNLDSTEIVITPDPDPEGCGFGLNDDIERLNVELTGEQQRILLRWMDSI